MKISDHKQMLARYGIDTPLRLAAFLAQTDHESQSFTRVVENLNYSAKALTATWPKRFPPDVAAQYHRQPERIANRAYSNRMGNGPEATGDGWRFRGHGYIQITGRDNHADFANAKKMTMDEAIAYMQTEAGAMESAAWWWHSRCLNGLADHGATVNITKIINGGLNGYAERLGLYEHAKEVFA